MPRVCLTAAVLTAILQAAGPISFRAQEIATQLGVVYAVTVADVNGDRKPDIVAINNDQLLWFENPSWNKHVITGRITAHDNVALAPRDVDGDQRLDFALGADWQPTNTGAGGTLHWVSSAGKVHNLGSEPTLHRIRWVDVDDDGRSELIVAPLHGKGTKAPDWTAGPGARLLVYRVPKQPATEPWPVETADDSLHIVHNFIGVGPEIWTASAEGVHALKRDSGGKWSKRLIGEGQPGEIKLGSVNGKRRLATVEPWHGNSIVVYDETPGVWSRAVIDTQLNQAHALGWGDFDGDGADELAVGWRGKPWGIALYKLNGTNWSKTMVDDGVAVEDLAVADLNGDGRPEIIAGGRATGNLRIYQVQAAAGNTGDEAAVRDLVKKYVDARERRDAEATRALFTADADQLVSSGQWRKGIDEVVKGTMASSQQTGGHRTISVQSVRFLTPDVALADGPYQLTELAAGEDRKMWTALMCVRTPGGWRIAAIRNMLPAPPQR